MEDCRKQTRQEQAEKERLYLEAKKAEYGSRTKDHILIHEGESRQVRRNRERLERKLQKQERQEYDRQMEIKERFAFSDAKKGEVAQ